MRLGNFYKYDFTSPAPLFAKIKEELRSYFDAGLIDDLLFPTWLNMALRRLGKSTYYVTDTIVEIEKYTGLLPANFHKVKEAWVCSILDVPGPNNSTIYQEVSSVDSLLLDTNNPLNTVTEEGDCVDCLDPNIEAFPVHIKATYKTTTRQGVSIMRQAMLLPGSHSAMEQCMGCFMENNYPYTFDISGNKFLVSFPNGKVHLVFYAHQTDEDGYQLIPDNIKIMDYIENHIKYKIFETMSHMRVDETQQQIIAKMMYYRELEAYSYSEAMAEIRNPSVMDKYRLIKNQRERFRMFNIK
jgi:hypothetical protein